MAAHTGEDAPPVVVVGAGLGGSAAAAFLTRAGVPVVVIERHEEPVPRPRAWVISARSQELFRGLGLDERVRTEGSPGTWRLQTVDTLLHVPTQQDSEDRTAGVSPTGAAICDQDVLEGLLLDDAVARGATLRRGVTVTDLDQDGHGEGVRVVCDRGDPIRASHVVLAEGSGARLSRSIGIGDDRAGASEERIPAFDQVLFRSRDLDAVMSDRAGRAFLCTGSGTIVFRRDLGRWQVQRLDRTFDDVESDIADAVGRRVDIDVIDHSPWQPSARLADAFRLGRVFLIGDAAHSMPPSLGMAGNLAVADAHNLAWKLAWVRDGRAGEGLLDTYEQERRPVDEYILRQSVAVTRGEEGVDLVTAQLGLGYPPGASDALVGEGDDLVVTDPSDLEPVVGARVPHRWLAPGRSTLDLADVDRFALIGPVEPTAPPLPFERVPAGTSTDGDERVWVIRPDGHVAAHVRADEVDRTLDVVLHRVGG